MPLEQEQVADHMFERRCRTQLRVAVVAVHALCLDLFAVDVHNLAAHLEFPHADRLADDLATDGQVQFVKVRGFIAPERRVLHSEGQRSLAVHLRAPLLQRLTVGSDKAIADLGSAVQRDLCGHGCACERLFGLTADVEILDVDLITQEQVNLSDDTRRADFVLILQIASVAPFEHKHLDLVFARAEVFRHVDLACHMADLAIRGELPVDVKVEAGVHAFEMQAEVVFFKRFPIDVDGTHIKPARVFGGDVRRVDRERVQNIGILGFIIGLIEFELPAHRNGEPVPLPLVEVGGQEVAQFPLRGKPSELPFSAKRRESVALLSVVRSRGFLRLIRDQVRVRLFAPLVERCKAFVVMQIVHFSPPF